MSDIPTADSGPVERKTSMASVAVYLVCLGALGILNATTTTNLIAGMPDVLEAFIAPVVPALTTLIVGYTVKHRPGGMSASARKAVAVTRNR